MTEEKLKEVKGEHPYGDLGQLILLVLFIVVWVLDSFFLRISTFLSDWAPLFIRLIIMGLGFIVSVYLFRSGHSVVEGDERPAKVVSDGAFKFVRHPLYLASMIFYFALTIATASFAALVLAIIILIFYNYIASYEEKLLIEKFGESYLKYKQKTGKWVPKKGG